MFVGSDVGWSSPGRGKLETQRDVGKVLQAHCRVVCEGGVLLLAQLAPSTGTPVGHVRRVWQRR